MKLLCREWCDWVDCIFETSSNKPYNKRKTKPKSPDPHSQIETNFDARCWCLSQVTLISKTLAIILSLSLSFSLFPSLSSWCFSFCFSFFLLLCSLSFQKLPVYLLSRSFRCMHELFTATALCFCSGFVENFLMGAPSAIINNSYKLIWGRSLETLGLFLENSECRCKPKRDGGKAFQETLRFLDGYTHIKEPRSYAIISSWALTNSGRVFFYFGYVKGRSFHFVLFFQ